MRYKPRSPREGINVSATHPLTEAATLVVGLGLLFLLVIVVLVFLVEIAMLYVSPETEARLFGSFSPADLTVDDDDDLRRGQLQELLDRLAAHWPERAYAFRVEIEDSEDANAFAFPGGLIVVTSALLDEAGSENEVAFVLAHELGHYRNRDHLRLLGRTAMLGIVLAAIRDRGMGLRIANLTSRHFSRRQEKRADAFAAGLVVAEYGHIGDALRFFERLTEADRGADWLAYLSTHPASRARIGSIEALAAERGWPDQGPTTPLDW